jgi:hypothetical protein
MPKLLPLAHSLALLFVLVAAPALAESGWDHRSMRSHYKAEERAEPQLAPGERRVGPILVGVAATTTRTAAPETVDSAAQQERIQRDSSTDGNRSSPGR